MMSGARTYSDQILEDLRRKILDGALPPGTRLVEMRLAEEYGSSQGPAREALQRLVQEGLAVRFTNVGTEVIRIEPEEIADVIELRGYVESMAIRRAVVRASDAELGRLNDPVERMLQAGQHGDRMEQRQADVAFHTMICHLAHSRVIETAWRSIYAKMQLIMSYGPQSDLDIPIKAERHRPIVDALIARDAERAVAANLVHLPTAETLSLT
jgi:DNA-binding GntR family transcriptional regulator